MRLLANGMTRGSKTYMTMAGEATAYVCIFSILYMGCYTSTFIDPSGEDKGKIFTNHVLYVVTRDSTKYIFDEPPAVASDTIVGVATPQLSRRLEVSIPLTEAVQIGESQHGNIKYVITKDGTKYEFDIERPPAIVNKSIVGTTKPIASGPMKVTMPLSDVREVCISEFSPEGTWIPIGFVAAIILVLVISNPYIRVGPQVF
jgi:hypothetical protein